MEKQIRKKKLTELDKNFLIFKGANKYALKDNASSRKLIQRLYYSSSGIR